MSDIIDQANDRAQLDLERAIRAARSASPLPAPCGHCLNCGESTGPAQRWCDDDCRDDWQARQPRR